MANRKKVTDENDFESLDKFAHSITLENTRPLNKRERLRWKAAKLGRPQKAAGTKAIPTLVTVEPKLLKRIDAYARHAGISRSQLFSQAAKAALAKAGRAA